MTVYRPQVVSREYQAYAGFAARLAAFLIDALVIGILLTVATLGRPFPVAPQGAAEAVNWHNLLETGIGFAYFTLFWSWLGGGQTPGMWFLGVRVVGSDGEPIGFLAALVRWIGIVVSAAALLVGLIWVAFDRRGQGWHDKLAGTFVVQVRGATSADRPETVASTAAERPHPVARGFAAIFGVSGGLLGLLGLGLGLAGDAGIPVGLELRVAGLLGGLGLIASLVAWWRPGLAALAIAGVVVGYWLSLSAFVGPWWSGYNLAVANPVTEQQYWADAPAVASFIVSAIFLGLGAMLALFGVEWDGSARSREAH